MATGPVLNPVRRSRTAKRTKLLEQIPFEGGIGMFQGLNQAWHAGCHSSGKKGEPGSSDQDADTILATYENDQVPSVLTAKSVEPRSQLFHVLA